MDGSIEGKIQRGLFRVVFLFNLRIEGYPPADKEYRLENIYLIINYSSLDDMKVLLLCKKLTFAGLGKSFYLIIS